MNSPIIHVSERDLVLHLYGESEDEPLVAQHLLSCAQCREEFGRLRDVLSLVDTSNAFGPAEEPGPAFEREVWTRLEPQLGPRRRSWIAEWLAPRRLVLAGTLAVLLIVAFLAGRFTRQEPMVPTSADADGNVAERVLVVAVVDHLDRSQMVLLEILNADVESAGELEVEQALARDLVAANRLYRHTAARTGNEGTGDVLDELERTLLEIANTPGDATKGELDALRARIASRGLLFKVRVVQSELRERERQAVIPGSQS